LRSAGQSAGAALAIRNAAIGALLVLPYFKLVEDTGSPISSSVFITKMKAALGYYAEHLHGFNSVYYLYDSGLTSYQNAPQGKDQNNAAHVIELLGALAAIRFVALKKSECTDTERYYEYAVRVASAQSALGFQNLGAETERQLTKALTQLQMLAILDRDHFVGAGGQRWAKENGFPRAFFSSPEYKGSLSGFLTTYLKWIDELRENKRSFDPFREGISAKAMSTLRTDRVAEPGKLGLRLSGEAFDVAANSIGGSKGGRPGSVAHFLKLSWEATSRMYDTFYGHAH
jgi:hypothetical protein